MKTIEALTGINFKEEYTNTTIESVIGRLSLLEGQIDSMKKICKEENFPTYHTELNSIKTKMEIAFCALNSIKTSIDNLDEL